MPNSRVILVADDEPVVLRFTESVLNRRGYKVLSASDGQKALELYREHQNVDLIITDVVMPVTNGPQLVKEIHMTDPEVRCVFMSGFSPEHVRQHGADPDCSFLRKPFTPDTLIRTVEQALDA